jgi:hypothetical protein
VRRTFAGFALVHSGWNAELSSLTSNKPIKPVVQQPDTSAITRRVAVADMLRGAALMLLALGCVLLCFHKQARFFVPSQALLVTATHVLGGIGAVGLLAAEGMNVFFLKKYGFPASWYWVVTATLVVFLLGGVLLFPEILFSPPSFLMVLPVAGSVFLAGWLAGFLLQDRLLLPPSSYAAYMRRKHDFRKVMLVFGRYPLVFFLAMLIFTTLLAWMTAFSAGYRWHDFDPGNPYGGLPCGFGYNLARVYLTWICILGLLYPLCKWLGRWSAS